MTTIATTSGLTDLSEQYSQYVARGSALIEPKFGSTFGHEGPDALDLLHRLTTNSLLDLGDGEARRTVLTNEKGRIIDVMWVVKRSDRELLLVSDAPDPGPMKLGIERFTIIEDAELNDLTGILKRWIVFGPDAGSLLGAVFPEVDFSDCGAGSIQGFDVVEGGVVLALRTDSAGPQSWLLMVDESAVSDVEDKFARLGLPRASHSLFDLVRILNREPIVGKESTEDVNPLEVGLMHLIDFDKGCYVGQEVIARLDTYDKVQRRLVSFRSMREGLNGSSVSEGDRVLSLDGGRDVGWVTSVAVDPRTRETIGLAILRKAYSSDGVGLVTSKGASIETLPC